MVPIAGLLPGRHSSTVKCSPQILNLLLCPFFMGNIQAKQCRICWNIFEQFGEIVNKNLATLVGVLVDHYLLALAAADYQLNGIK